MPNPAYPEYLANVQLYNQILHDTFVLMASYQFPALPCTGSWKWYQSQPGLPVNMTTDQIPQDCDHELAMPTGGWKMILRVMPIADQANSSIWNNFIQGSMLYCPPQYPADYRVRKLTTKIG